MFGGQTDMREQLHAPRLRAVGSRIRFTRIGASVTFCERGHVREQIEVLEHHADTLRASGRRGVPVVRSSLPPCSR